jgi:hypothetical protein
VNQLADRIIEALRHPKWRNDVMPHNWEIIRAKASWARSMEEMTAHYCRLIRENHERNVS